MAKIESKIGWLKAVDTDKRTIDFRPFEYGARTIQQGERPLDKLTRYSYAENIEWEDEYFYDNIGEKVKIRLENNIVVKIELA